MTDQRNSGEIRAGPAGPAVGELRRRLGISQPVVDATVAVMVFGASVINVAAQAEVDISDIPSGGFILLAVASGAIYWRRSSPLVVLATVLAMTVIWMALDYPGNPVFHILTSLYAVGRNVVDWKSSMAALSVALAVVGFGQVTDGDPVSDLVTGLVLTALAWYVGLLLRNRAIAARERAEYLEWKRESEAHQAIADARAAIARELHDVVAHNVSVMTVQAGVARLVVVEDPAKAQEAIGAVEEGGRRALDELRHLLGVLRPDAQPGELGPQPGLTQVEDLAEQLRKTGMSISVTADVRSELPIRVDLFAYRIVQESLTNVLKHAGVDAEAHVRLEERDGHLDIEVTNTGTMARSLTGSAQGIVGMQERAILLGGTFEAGPRTGGGFRVAARLPIGDQ